MSYLRDALKAWLPPAVIDIGHAARAFARLPLYRSLLARNRDLRQTRAGRSVVIIGNGPSLKYEDWSLYEGVDAIVMNLFNKASVDVKVNIVAHCFGEPKTSSGWNRDEIVKSINEVAADAHWVHFSGVKYLSGIQSGKDVRCVLPGIEPSIWVGSRLRLDRISMGYVTTAQLAIQVAVYMGYHRILLIGFDHDWLASPNYSRHFYSDDRDENDTLQSLRYGEIIKFMGRMWSVYETLYVLSVKAGIEIRNGTEGGFLDVFPRIPRGEFRSYIGTGRQ
jgi:hypothetical protein